MKKLSTENTRRGYRAREIRCRNSSRNNSNSIPTSHLDQIQVAFEIVILVTRYSAAPRITASRIALSSGSRQIFNSPDVCTTVARLAMSRTKVRCPAAILKSSN